MCLQRLFPDMQRNFGKRLMKLNGTELPQGDVGYQINAFACEPMRFYFWDRDEEFEAQANMLFDSEITEFMHEET